MAVDYKKIGKRIQEARNLREMSVAELAGKVQFTAKSIILVENGNAALTLELLLPICTVLNVCPNDLLEGEYRCDSNKTLEEESLLHELRELVQELKDEVAQDSSDVVLRDTASVVQEIRDMLREQSDQKRNGGGSGTGGTGGRAESGRRSPEFKAPYRNPVGKPDDNRHW